MGAQRRLFRFSTRAKTVIHKPVRSAKPVVRATLPRNLELPMDEAGRRPHPDAIRRATSKEQRGGTPSQPAAIASDASANRPQRRAQPEELAGLTIDRDHHSIPPSPVGAPFPGNQQTRYPTRVIVDFDILPHRKRPDFGAFGSPTRSIRLSTTVEKGTVSGGWKGSHWFGVSSLPALGCGRKAGWSWWCSAVGRTCPSM